MGSDQPSIVQLLYDSEINIEVSCFWDAGFPSGSATLERLLRRGQRRHLARGGGMAPRKRVQGVPPAGTSRDAASSCATISTRSTPDDHWP
jgi:hypothetical protein